LHDGLLWRRTVSAYFDKLGLHKRMREQREAMKCRVWVRLATIGCRL